MKKITYFMLAAASCMFAMPASAFDVDTAPTSADAITNGYYVLKTHAKAATGYLHHNGATQRPFRQTVDYDPATSTDLSYVFKLVKDETTGAFTLQCLGNAAFIPHDSDRNQQMNGATTEANAAALKTEAIPEGAAGEILDGGVLLYDSKFEVAEGSSQYYIHFNAPGGEYNASYWNGAAMTAADHTVAEFAFYKVNDEFVEVTYNLPDGTQSKGYAIKGSEAVVPSTTRPANMSFYYSDATITNEDKIVSETNNTFDVKFAIGENIPFAFSTTDSETWYTMNVRQAGYYLVANSNDDNVASRTTPTVEQILDGSADWKFVESGYGVKVANKIKNKYLKAATTNAVTEFVDADEATEFVVIENGSGFSLKIPSTDYCIGDHVGSKLGTWASSASTSDSGSRFTATSALESVQENIDTQVDAAIAASDETLLGHYNTDDVNVIALARDNATSLNDYIAINDKLKTLESVSTTPDADAYYQIVCANSINKKFITTEAITVGTDGTATTTQTIGRSSASDAIVPQLWQFEATDGGYKVVNANTGRAFGAVSAVSTGVQDVDKSEAGDITLQQLSTKVNFILKSGEHRLNAFQGDWNTIVADYTGNHDGDAGNYWKIKKVTTIPVEISEANYATVGFPFAVTIPEGIKAFVGTSTEDATLVLTEIADGIIPANTGAIIYHEGATTADFTITTGGNAITGNKLSATTAKREGFAGNDTYVLALNEDGNAAFLQSELTTVPANKAFLAASEVTSSNGGALAFSFGGNTTGVNSAVANDAKDTQYFDLQGRRVLYPANGIFVTNSGKKIFVK